MKQPSKAELRGRIAELERMVQGTLSFSQINAQHHIGNLERRCKRATIAAYALLATLAGVVIMEVVW